MTLVACARTAGRADEAATHARHALSKIFSEHSTDNHRG